MKDKPPDVHSARHHKCTWHVGLLPYPLSQRGLNFFAETSPSVESQPLPYSFPRVSFFFLLQLEIECNKLQAQAMAMIKEKRKDRALLLLKIKK